MENQKMMNWLEKAKKNDSIELEAEKKKIVQQIKGLSKEDVIPRQVKLTLWQRIKKALNF